jgi:SAM-dependent methyltransferase
VSAAPVRDWIAPDRLALIARTLRIPPDTWLAVLAAFHARRATVDERAPAPRGDAEDAEIDRCLAALAPAYRALSPHETAPLVAAPPRACAACERVAMRPLLARRSPPPDADLLYGRCVHCGHGSLLAVPDEVHVRARHAGDDYYRARDRQGVGYEDYAADADYRERKGADLIERLRRALSVRRLLEVGSGFGYTRAAAERAGVRTAGVDVNAHAVVEATRRFGLDTFHGTLAEALASPASDIAPGTFDAVLYQFVLEHVVDPAAELIHARDALAPDGWLALLVPNMDAAEIDAFGASYRSFRGDHLHLFSRASLAALFARAGFALRALDSHCNIHLFRDLMPARALDRLYAAGRGPDLFVLAQRRS